MKDKIVADIRALERGAEFKIRDYFEKYNLYDNKQNFKLCMDVLKEVEGDIEPKIKPIDGKYPIVGLPENFIYIKK